MKISSIYSKYKIMPQLELHQLRVAGVATLIVDNFSQDIDKNTVIAASLLHDMGNIIKFKLDLFPESLKPRGIKYWERVKKEFVDKYGKIDHRATIKIAKEIGVEDKIIKTIKDLEFSKSREIGKSNDLNKKIVKYADLRVSPYGVVSLKDRLAEAKKRYVMTVGSKWTEREFNNLASIWDKIEKEIFYLSNISPNDITDNKVVRLIPNLKTYNIKIS